MHKSVTYFCEQPLNKIYLQVTKERKTRSKTTRAQRDLTSALQSTSMQSSSPARREESLQCQPDQHQFGMPPIEDPSSFNIQKESLPSELDQSQSNLPPLEDPLSSKNDQNQPSASLAMRMTQWKSIAMKHLQTFLIKTFQLYSFKALNQFQQSHFCKIN